MLGLAFHQTFGSDTDGIVGSKELAAALSRCHVLMTHEYLSGSIPGHKIHYLKPVVKYRD